jgi:hypothetical protein
MCRMKVLVLVVVVGACNGNGNGGGGQIECGPGTVAQGMTCVATGTTCGTGMHELDGACVADTWFQIRALPIILADGRSATEVRAFGATADGSPSHDAIVVSVDRASAGAFVSPGFVLDDLGGATNFIPCTSATTGCEGPAQFALALASVPQTPLATVDVQLAGPSPVGSTAPCLAGGNILYFDGQDFDYNGPVTFSTDGHFNVSGADDRVNLGMVSDTGAAWTLELNTHALGIPMIASVYDGAVSYGIAKPGQPGFDLIGNGPVPTGCTTIGDFQIEEFVHVANPDTVTLLTATFVARCGDDPTRRLDGCVHYAQ